MRQKASSASKMKAAGALAPMPSLGSWHKVEAAKEAVRDAAKQNIQFSASQEERLKRPFLDKGFIYKRAVAFLGASLLGSEPISIKPEHSMFAQL